jgi:hypothetical protein
VAADFERFRMPRVRDRRLGRRRHLAALEAAGFEVIRIPMKSKHLSLPMKFIDGLVRSGRLHHDGDPVATWGVSNVEVKPGKNDSWFPLRGPRKKKIDPALALIVAMNRAMVDEDVEHRRLAEERPGDRHEKHRGDPAGMTPLRSIALRLGSKMASYGGGVTLSLTDDKLGNWLSSAFGTSTNSGKTINDDSAMRVTTAFACVRTIAETIGEVTLGVYERQKNGNAEKVDHELASILVEKPNTDMTRPRVPRGDGDQPRRARQRLRRDRPQHHRQRRSLYPVPWARARVKRDQSTDWQLLYQVRDRGKWETTRRRRSGT